MTKVEQRSDVVKTAGDVGSGAASSSFCCWQKHATRFQALDEFQLSFVQKKKRRERASTDPSQHRTAPISQVKLDGLRCLSSLSSLPQTLFKITSSNL